ncbi:MAG: 3'-5' exonuclease [Luteibaculaceae bacterium]
MSLQDILFIDIETVSAKPNFKELDATTQILFEEKLRFYMERHEVSAEEAYQRAGIYAEFGKVICISCGFFEPQENRFRVKSFYGHNENLLLLEFGGLLNHFFKNRSSAKLCAHNGKEFDFPFLGRRFLINKITLPDSLNLQGKKPWHIDHLDTLELWKFGDYKHYTSLNLLAHVFGIESPKDDIDGSKVSQVYWEEKNLKRIANYCEKDVVTVASVYACLIGLNPITKDKIDRQKSAVFN